VHVRHAPLPCGHQMGLFRVPRTNWDRKEMSLQDLLITVVAVGPYADV